MTLEQSSNSLAQLMAQQFAKPPLKAPLEIHSVSARGLPNQERVYIRVNTRTYLGDYLLLAGVFLPDGRAIPVPNVSLWLGGETIDSGSWILVYTGPGEGKLMTQMKDTKEPVLVLHWQVPTTIFEAPNMVPVLVKIDVSSTQIGQAAGDK
jgi:hypothetical protein